MSAILDALNRDAAALAEEASRALVEVHTGAGGTGSGTLWHPEGLVITNAHVAQSGPLWVVTRDGQRLPARLLARDAYADLAALAVPGAGFPTVRLGDARALRAGQYVLALGHPWGVTGAATAGVVIGVGPSWLDQRGPARDWIHVSLHLRPGYSGGPLVDGEGRLVGINTLATGPDTGMAVPMHRAAAFLKEALGARAAA